MAEMFSNERWAKPQATMYSTDEKTFSQEVLNTLATSCHDSFSAQKARYCM
jgi:hypothetical protein